MTHPIMRFELELFRQVIDLAAYEAVKGDPDARQFFSDPTSNFRTMCEYLELEPENIARAVLERKAQCRVSPGSAVRRSRQRNVLPLFTDTDSIPTSASIVTGASASSTAPAGQGGYSRGARTSAPHLFAAASAPAQGKA